MGSSRSRVWALAAAAALVALLAADMATGPDVVMIALFAIAPLLASLGAAWRTTAGIGVLAVLAAGGSLATTHDMEVAEGTVFVFGVALVGGLAAGGALVRTRREAAAARSEGARLVAEADEAFGILDAVFARAPVGLAIYDRDLRCLRINEHLAAINGIPATDHIGRHVSELVPDVDDVERHLRSVLETGSELTQIEVAGSTSAAPGVRREFDVSYFPVRRRGHDAVLGVGCVVFEVTERRVADRALREQTARYESLLLALSEVGEAMVVLEDDRVAYANAAFLTLTGHSSDELRALPSIYDLVEDREAARGGHVTLRHRDGRRILMEVAGVPLEVGGRSQMIVVGRDVTARARAEAERERLLERAAFLAEASATFDAVLDEERTLHALARLSVRELADTCVILLGGSVGTVRRVCTVARDPGDEAELRELVERYSVADRRSHPLFEVLASGRSQVVEHADGPARSTALVPLRARGRTLGVMALGFGAVVGEDHLSLLEDLARRAALAIDNARLYGERAAVARTLQRSLLPPVLPDVPGIDIAARYVAAGEGNEVGGDFYDCFPTRDGDWAVVIGDVCGKGAEAAAVTALARYTVRASAMLHSDHPQVVLQDLNDAIRRESPASRFCTVLYVALGMEGDRVKGCVASGGHPLPLILRSDGRVETAGLPGTLLGILPDPEIRPQELVLRPGDSLILYTDGVIEASPLDDRFGPEHLARCVSECHGRAPVAIARHIEDAVLAVQGGTVRDDVAVLVLRVSPHLRAPFVAERPGVAAST